MYLLDGAEAYFGSPEKGTFDAHVFYRIGIDFLTTMKTFLHAILGSD